LRIGAIGNQSSAYSTFASKVVGQISVKPSTVSAKCTSPSSIKRKIARELIAEIFTASSTVSKAAAPEHSGHKMRLRVRERLMTTTSRTSMLVLVRRLFFITDSRAPPYHEAAGDGEKRLPLTKLVRRRGFR